MALKTIVGVAVASIKTWGTTPAASIGSVGGSSGGGGWPHGPTQYPGPLWYAGAAQYVNLPGSAFNYSFKQLGAETTWVAIEVGRTTGGGRASSWISTKSDGTLWTWGRNNTGQLGLNNTIDYSSPKQIGALTTWSKISASSGSTIAIKSDGTLWTWGLNSYGQLGLGNTTTYSSPKQVGALATWSECAAGQFTMQAIKSDGTLWTWGRNNSGQLGLNTITNYSSPKQVGALTNWSKVKSNYGSSVMTIKTDGTLWTWGLNKFGVLGDGALSKVYSPKQIGALTNWANISISSYRAGGVKTDGTLWTWGCGTYGVLGHNNPWSYYSPKQVGALTNWAKIFFLGGDKGGGSFAAWHHAAAIKTDKTQWAWGASWGGCLGVGVISGFKSSPIQVGSPATWETIAGAYLGKFAIQATS